MGKIRWTIIYVLIIIMSIMGVAYAETGLKDVDGTEYEEAVTVMLELGIMNAIPGKDEIGVDKELTRAEAAKLLVVCTGKEDMVWRYEGITSFQDVPANHWASGYINILTSAPAVFPSYDDGTFKPDDKVTYGDFVVASIRLLGYGNIVDVEGTYPANYMMKNIELGLDNNMNLSKNDIMTRGETAKYMWNVLSKPIWIINNSADSNNSNIRTYLDIVYNGFKLEVPVVKDVYEARYPLSQKDIIMEIEGIEDEKLNYKRHTSGNDVGEYPVTIKLSNKYKYIWADGTQDDKEIKIIILEEEFDIPTINQKLKYTGAEQEIKIEKFKKYDMDISGIKGTSAGIYEAVISLKDEQNSIWKDGTKEDKIIKWEIEKVDWECEIGNNNQMSDNVTPINVSFSPAVTDGAISIEYSLESQELYSQTLPTLPGSYKVKIELKNDTNLVDGVCFDTLIIEEAPVPEVPKEEIEVEKPKNEEKEDEKVEEIPEEEDNIEEIVVEEKLDIFPNGEIKSLNYGYKSNDVVANQVVIRNLANNDINIINVEPSNKNDFEIVGNTNFTISANSSYGLLKIRPKVGLDVGEYETNIIVTVESGNKYVSLNVRKCTFKVLELPKEEEESEIYATINSMEEFIVAASNSNIAEITLNKDISYTYKTGDKELIFIIENKDRMLDLNGHKFTSNIDLRIDYYTDNEFVIEDSSKRKTGTIENKAQISLINVYAHNTDCTLTIEDGNFVRTIVSEYPVISLRNVSNSAENECTLKIKGGNFESEYLYSSNFEETEISIKEISLMPSSNGERTRITDDTGVKLKDIIPKGRELVLDDVVQTDLNQKLNEIIATESIVIRKVIVEEQKDKPEEKKEEWINPYKDVENNDWYYEAIKFVSEKGICNGINDVSFGVNQNVTRGMLVTMLYRTSDVKEVKYNSSFKDVDESMYYSAPVMWAEKNRIVNGISDTEFGPNKEITREQFVVILYRYAQHKGYKIGKNSEINQYDDVSQISSYALDAFKWAVKNDIISGRTASTLAPKGTATRAEVATMLMRFSEKIK